MKYAEQIFILPQKHIIGIIFYLITGWPPSALLLSISLQKSRGITRICQRNMDLLPHRNVPNYIECHFICIIHICKLVSGLDEKFQSPKTSSVYLAKNKKKKRSCASRQLSQNKKLQVITNKIILWYILSRPEAQVIQPYYGTHKQLTLTHNIWWAQ